MVMYTVWRCGYIVAMLIMKVVGVCGDGRKEVNDRFMHRLNEGRSKFTLFHDTYFCTVNFWSIVSPVFLFHFFCT